MLKIKQYLEITKKQFNPLAQYATGEIIKALRIKDGVEFNAHTYLMLHEWTLGKVEMTRSIHINEFFDDLVHVEIIIWFHDDDFNIDTQTKQKIEINDIERVVQETKSVSENVHKNMP